MATDYVAQFQSDMDNCRTAIGNDNLVSATRYMAMAKASHASILAMKEGDQGSSVDRENAMNGLNDAIQALRKMVAEDGGAGAVVHYVGRP